MRRSAAPPFDLQDAVLSAWSTSNRVTTEFISGIPPELWSATPPGIPHRSIRGMGAHLHNTRCGWIRTLGREHGIATPARVDKRTVTQRQLVVALMRSSRGMERLLRLGCARGGRLPPSKGYVWRNLALDVEHVLTYFIAHEAHHRGQILMAARQLNQRLPPSVTAGLWQWRPR